MTNPFLYSPIKPKKDFSTKLVDYIQAVVVILAIIVVSYLFIFIPNQVDGRSMMPNFHNGELLFTDKTIQIIGSIKEDSKINYRRGDVVIFKKPGLSDYIKRVIALPGERVMISNGKIHVNGQLLEEEYIADSVKTLGYDLGEGVEKTVPKGHYFLVGDNRNNSRDSRFSDIGFVNRSYIKGRVFLRYTDCEEEKCKLTFDIIRRLTY